MKNNYSNTSCMAYGAKLFLESFGDLGEIIKLPQSGLGLIKRQIDDQYTDLTGVYPFSMCNDWSMLSEDMNYIYDTGAVSVVFVSDPYCEEQITNSIKNWTICSRFKKHYTLELSDTWSDGLSKETRRVCRRAMESHEVKMLKPDKNTIEEFWKIHRNIIEKHNITGIGKLSLKRLEKQASVDGAFLFNAEFSSRIYSSMFVYLINDKAFLYLLGMVPEAYRVNTNYALFFKTFELLKNIGVRSVNIGGNSGLQDENDGLSQFKKKWANKEHYTLLCGHVLREKEYLELIRRSSVKNEMEYFPAYRAQPYQANRE